MLAAGLSHRDEETLPANIRSYLSQAGCCSVCERPFFGSLVTCTLAVEPRSVSALALLTTVCLPPPDHYSLSVVSFRLSTKSRSPRTATSSDSFSLCLSSVCCPHVKLIAVKECLGPITRIHAHSIAPFLLLLLLRPLQRIAYEPDG